MLILIIIVILSFVLMHSIQMFAFGSRVAGRMAKRVGLGTTLSETTNKLQGFFIILFLPTLAYLVESGITIYDYIIFVTVAYILTFLVSIIMIMKIHSLQQFYQVLFIKYNVNSIPVAILKSLINKKTDLNIKDCDGFTFDKVILKKTLVSCVAYIFLVTGFFSAFMLAVLFPENRLTFSQFSTVVHGFGVVLFSFYLDPMLSRSIDSYLDEDTWLKNVYSILLGRAISYFVVIILLLIFLLLKIFWL
jgi:hypothetical protein